MKKRLSVLLLIVFGISVFLLGFSYAKESGKTEDASYIEKVDDDYRVVFQDGYYLDKINNVVTFNLVNKAEEERTYVVSLNETLNQEYENVYYSVDGGDKILLSDENVLKVTLSAYGSDGDLEYHKIILYTDDESLKFRVDVISKDEDYLVDIIKSNSKYVYVDSESNYRYYGYNANNYVKIKDNVYQIIGYIDGKIKLISDVRGLGVYNPSKREYATLKDYFGSFNNDNVNVSNVLQYKSWMTGTKGYWLQDTDSSGKAYYASMINGVGTSIKKVDYYLRYVYYMNDNLIYLSGSGTKSDPYEVTYGS